MTSPLIPGGTSTGSKRPAAFVGDLAAEGFPRRMTRSSGARLWDDTGREYLDYVMALGAVTLGYAHPEVVSAARQAVADGAVGSLAPVVEGSLAQLLVECVPGIERVRFLKTGAEAVAAAVRAARVATGRDRVVTCGYHGWLDWCQNEPGVPRAVTELAATVAFNDGAALQQAVGGSDPVAAVVVEPVVEGYPDPSWLTLLRTECDAAGAVLVFDEIKTGFRLAVGGAAERFGVVPDLVVLGKGLANGFPLAAVGGSLGATEAFDRTWISSTLATEQVSLAAAHATVTVSRRDGVPGRLRESGGRLFEGLAGLARRHSRLGGVVRGVPEMCYVAFPRREVAWRVTAGMAGKGVLWKPSAYNFVSLAHTDDDIERTLGALDEVLGSVSQGDP